ncbi:ricin B lectin domain-containing protein [Gymnopilus junonius]|uniref:Ricin B lectin domain-containing protein n=1 Tax=Gymnopilus junonius TaxID=109634 RepID=A0A9P5NBV5_GYMJU|nr:ricin B lectin domain-containing protein [Gymnopilus junonius]
MKISYALAASLFAAAKAQFIGAPKAGATLVPGQNFTVQITGSVNTSPAAGFEEVSLVIGIVACGTSPCPVPSSDLGEVLLIGKYEAKGSSGEFDTFENFTFTVPNDISGAASIQAQLVTLTTPPGHSQPNIAYDSVKVQVGSGSSGSGSSSLNIHPNFDNSKCVGILGGTYADGNAVDIFDCNESITQNWQLNNNAITSINPADGSQWCIDSGDQSTWTNGLKMKIWQCFSNLPQQNWTFLTESASSGLFKLTGSNFCLDLTNGDKTNQNVLQIWTCSGDENQTWSLTPS